MGSTCSAEKRTEIVEDAKEMVVDAAEQVKAAAQDAAETIAEVAGDAQEKVEEAKDLAADTMTAAMAAVTGVMYVEFDAGKGCIKTVEFKSKALAFTPARGGAGCCASAPKASVVVGKVDKNQQAYKLGVKRGWAVKTINGTEVTGLEEARKLLEDGIAKIAEA